MEDDNDKKWLEYILGGYFFLLPALFLLSGLVHGELWDGPGNNTSLFEGPIMAALLSFFLPFICTFVIIAFIEEKLHIQLSNFKRMLIWFVITIPFLVILTGLYLDG